MPRPSLGRVQLRLRVTPGCKTALGLRPSEKARELLEEWARGNASTPGPESTEVEEPPPPSSGPAKTKRNEGAMTDPHTTP